MLRRLFAVGLLGIWIAGGCASGPIHAPEVDGTDLVENLPDDVRRKYEARAEDQPEPIETKGKKKHKPASLKKKKAFKYPNLRLEKDPMSVGDLYHYDVVVLGIVASTLTIEVLPFKVINSRKVYHLRIKAVSTSLLNLVYRFDDAIETYIDYEGLYSHRFQLLMDESKQKRNSIELYDSEKGETFYWNRKKERDKPFEEVKTTEKMPPFPQDLVSALIRMRYMQWTEGASYSHPLVNEGKVSDMAVTFVRRDPEFDSVLGEGPAVVVTPTIMREGQIQHQDNIYIWISDDERHIPLKVEAKVRIGMIRFNLKAIGPLP